VRVRVIDSPSHHPLIPPQRTQNTTKRIDFVYNTDTPSHEATPPLVSKRIPIYALTFSAFTLGPGGAAECSYGWSDGAAQPAGAQPVESRIPRSSRPEGAKETIPLPASGQAIPTCYPRVPLRYTRGYIPWPFQGQHPVSRNTGPWWRLPASVGWSRSRRSARSHARA
jgi:hypothetical protein